MGKTMETAQHTPGPWTLSGVTIKTRDFGGEFKLQSSGFIPDDKDFANARLIAVAPEMLALLKEIAWSPVGSAKSGLEFKIRQLIAKAEGHS